MAISDLIQETIAQHIISPKVISYVASKLNEVQGRFVSANRVYNFVLDKKGVSYSPAGQGDSLLFSALYLRQDAARKPKVGNDKCNAGKSYQCGKICLGNRRKCHKGVRDVNDARRIASILASTNEGLKNKVKGQVSDKANNRGKALFEARGERAANPKVKPDENDALNRLEQWVKLGEESKPETFESKISRMLSNKLTSQKDSDQFNQDLKSLTPEQKKQYFDERAKVRSQQDKARKSEKAKLNKKKKESQKNADLERQQYLESFPEGRLSLRVQKERDEHLKNVKQFYGSNLGDLTEFDKTEKKLQRLSSVSNKLLKLHESAFNPTPAQKQQQLMENNESLDDLLNRGKALSSGVRDDSAIPWTLTYPSGGGYKTTTIVGARVVIDDKGENYIEITRGDSLANIGDHAIDRIKDGTWGDPFLNGGYNIFFPKGQANTLRAKRLVREMTQGTTKNLDFTFEGRDKEGVIKKNDIDKLLSVS